jgi:integrase
MKIKLRYVIERRAGRRSYFYFRKGVDSQGSGTLIPLPNAPGTREFSDRYEQLLAENAPKVLHAVRGGEKGTLAWVITKFCAFDNPAWTKLKPSTQAVYRRHFDWLRENFGDVLLCAFDKQLIRRIRDLRKADPSVANMSVDKIGQLWAWAEEFGGLTLPGNNPARQVASLPTDGEAAPAWSPELCQAFEAHSHERMKTFYYLARYTGQRKGDCCAMKWTDFDGLRILVTQEKTGTKLWIKAHRRLREYLNSLPRESEYILTSPKGGAYRKTSVTNIVCEIASDLGFKGHSPHGLRHLAGAALAESGCSVNQIMSILGHLTEKQAYHYVAQANRVRMGDDAIDMWEQADERLAENVIGFPTEGTQSEQSAAKLENPTGKRRAK